MLTARPLAAFAFVFAIAGCAAEAAPEPEANPFANTAEEDGAQDPSTEVPSVDVDGVQPSKKKTSEVPVVIIDGLQPARKRK